MTTIVHTFNDTAISQRPDDGYVDATATCQANGKLFADYQRLDTTQKFLEALSLNMGIPIIKLVETKPGRYGGTWIHPLVAINLGQWCNPEFAVFISKLIYDWMTGSRTTPTLDFHDLLINSDLTRADLRVLALLDRNGNDGMDYAAMGRSLGMDRATVYRSLRRLQDKRFIEVVERQVEYRLCSHPSNLTPHSSPLLESDAESKS